MSAFVANYTIRLPKLNGFRAVRPLSGDPRRRRERRTYNTALIHSYSRRRQETPRGIDEFLQNIIISLADYRENRVEFPSTGRLLFCKLLPCEFPILEAQLFKIFTFFHHLQEKIGGYFVEFGATNRRRSEHTYQLEKRFQWRGILASPRDAGAKR